MDRYLRRLGGKLGIGVALLGFLVMGLGWNGAASFPDLRQQFPYLISGGLIGLALVVLGAALLITESQREQRAEMLAALAQLRAAVEQSAGASGGRPGLAVAAGPGQVVAARLSFHRPDCRLVDGQLGLRALDLEEALAEGLEPCRICDPAALPVEPEPAADTVAVVRPRRRAARAAG